MGARRRKQGGKTNGKRCCMLASRHDVDGEAMIACMLGVIRIEEHTLALAFESR